VIRQCRSLIVSKAIVYSIRTTDHSLFVLMWRLSYSRFNKVCEIVTSLKVDIFASLPSRNPLSKERFSVAIPPRQIAADF